MEKYFPKIGDKLYLQQHTKRSYVDMVKTPYTVIDVTIGHVTIQKCKLIFDPNDNYYNSLPIEIKEDRDGEILKLSWSRKRNSWIIDRYKTGYPEYAVFGKWEYFPYLD